MSELLVPMRPDEGCNRSHSVALGRNRSQSVALCGTLRHTAAIIGNQRPSVAISGHQRTSPSQVRQRRDGHRTRRAARSIAHGRACWRRGARCRGRAPFGSHPPRPHLMNDSISGHQCSSIHLRLTQRHQWSSVLINTHQCSSVLIRLTQCHQCPSVLISAHQCSFASHSASRLE